VTWKGRVPRSIAELFNLAETEPAARKLLDAQARRIAEVTSTVCAVLDPELVVLGGGIGSYPQLLEPVRRYTDGALPVGTRIETSLLREQAALYGALAVALREARDQLFNRSNGKGPQLEARTAPSI
jgi:predicted NBD/HSP70 family sugar kinase